MPALLITMTPQKTQWIAEIANTNPPISYTFSGASLEAQVMEVKNLATLMRNAGSFDVADLQYIMQIGNAAPETVFDQLFAMNSQIMLNADVIYICKAGEVLEDSLAEAGEALAAVFA